jgi:acyl-coenzyme A thioesterase PaaI-like protein
MRARQLDAAPCTVTSDFAVTLRRPTPVGPELVLWAKAVQVDGDRVTVEATLSAEGKVCASCRGTFVAVKPGHPAYHRW